MNSKKTKKLALLIGINYINSSDNSLSLNGCINDVKNVKKTLITQMGYLEKDIVMLTDESLLDKKKHPTRQNILYNIYMLVFRARIDRSVSEIFIHFSGHGTYIRDTNYDEADGRDECIVPCDFESRGIITDDALQYYLKLIPKQVKCFCLFDSCHSGTVTDLQYMYDYNLKNWQKQNKKILSSDVIMVSGCRDDQTSYDFFAVSRFTQDLEPNQFMGAMTCAFLSTLYKFNFSVTIHDMIVEMNAFMVQNGFDQSPQLSASLSTLDPIRIKVFNS